MNNAMQRALTEAEKHGALYVNALRRGEATAEREGYTITAWDSSAARMHTCGPVGAALMGLDPEFVVARSLEFPHVYGSPVINDLGIVVRILDGAARSWYEIVCAVDGEAP